jgi:hypothetical protein
MSAKRYLTHDGRTASLQEWADQIGISREALVQRLLLGWPVAEAVTTPRHKRTPKRLRREIGQLLHDGQPRPQKVPMPLPFEQLRQQHLAIQRQFNSTLRQFNRDLHAIMSRSLDRGVVVDLSENANDRSLPSREIALK